MSEIVNINPKKDNPMRKYAIQFKEDGKLWASSIEAKTFRQAESLVSSRVTVLGHIVSRGSDESLDF